MGKIKFIDLFSGIGGFRLAFESLGCECVYSSDIDEHACKTYALNFGDNPKSDITKVNPDSIPNFDILCAGFPCQPFSIAGKRLGFNDTRGTLFFDVARILKYKKPKALFLENVKGLVNHEKGKTLEVITNTLRDLGYTIKFDVLNAKDYGVPQNRERWYCLGIRNDVLKNNKLVGIEIELVNRIAERLDYSVEWSIINHASFVSALKNKEIEFPNKIKIKYTLKDIIKNVDDTKYKSSKICGENITRFMKIKNVKTNFYTLAYEARRSRCQFSTNGISPCLTAKMGTGGNNVPVVVQQKRRLTEKECLKIMGFPPSYKIYKGSHTYKQIGNSVCVPVIVLLAKKLLKCLRG